MQWEEASDEYEKLYGTFVRTPVLWNDKKKEVDPEATYDDPTLVFPNSYVEYIKVLYGEEDDTTASMITDQLIVKPD